MPGCGARVPRREPRTRTGRHAPRSRSERTRGSRQPGARLGSGSGRRGSRRQRRCRRRDAAAGCGCECVAERCPLAPASAPPPSCGPLSEPPAPRRGDSEPGLPGCGPARPAPAQREVSASARSLPALVSHPRRTPPSTVLTSLRGARSPRLSRAPSPERAAGRPTTPPVPVGPGQRAPRVARATLLPLGVVPGRPPGGVGLGSGRGCPARLSRSCAGGRLGAGRPGDRKGREGRGAATAAQVGEQHGLQVFGKPRVMAIGRGGSQPSLHRQPPERAARPLGARSSLPPARGRALRSVG